MRQVRGAVWSGAGSPEYLGQLATIMFPGVVLKSLSRFQAEMAAKIIVPIQAQDHAGERGGER